MPLRCKVPNEPMGCFITEIINQIMKKSLLLLFILSSFISFYSILNAVGDEEVNTEIQEYNPADYDPGIPLDWIKEDGTFGE
ncbi:MAG: hypothetical protein HHAS10_04510 [Candidatus Altimarinota bacterium]